MKTSLIAVLALLLCASAHADNASSSANIQAFFAAAEGNYSGSGETRQFSAAGEKDTEYGIELQGRLDGDGSLALDARIDADGNPSSSQVTLRLSGETLYYGSVPYGTAPGSAIPVRIVEATATSLAYSFETVGGNGLIYAFENHYSVDSDGSLSVHDTISVNGSVIQDDAFVVTRY